MFSSKSRQSAVKQDLMKPPRKGGTWLDFCWVCAAGLYPVIVYPVANYRPYRSPFWANM